MKSVVIPDSVTTIEKGAFVNCASLEAVTLPAAVTAVPESCFEGCAALKTVTHSDTITKIGAKAFSGCSPLTGFTIPKTLTELGAGCFSGCAALAKVDFTLAENGFNIPASAFKGCTGLTEVVFSDKTGSIGEYAFNGCTSLAAVTLGAGNRRDIGKYAFAGCSKLVSFDSSASNGQLTLYDGAFLDCPMLTDITLENMYYYSNDGFNRQVGWNTVTNVAGEKFYALTPDMKIRGSVSSETSSYAIKNGISFYPTSGVAYTEEEDHVVIDKWTLRYWTVTVPAQIAGKPVTVIGKNAFKNLGDLEDVYLPGCLKEIQSGAFMNSSARDMTIPASVERIGSKAFCGSRFEASYLGVEFAVVGDGILYRYNGKAEDVVLPENVKHIGEDAFAYALYTFHLSDEAESYHYYSFDSFGSALGMNISGAAQGDVLTFAVYKDSVIIPVVKSSEEVVGDVNSDGEFTIADVVAVQKWLLADPSAELKCWENANLCEDDRLDLFDLCMMKKTLLSIS